MPGSPLTTHVLDTALGAPARNLKIQLFMEEMRPDSRMWKQVAAGYVPIHAVRFSDFLICGIIRVKRIRSL